MSENTYKELILDAKCLKPAYEVRDQFIYTDAMVAISCALNHPYITDSETKILQELKKQIRINRFNNKK
jgi:hypothetical protein